MKKIHLLLCALSIVGTSALAADKTAQAPATAKRPEPTAEQRQKMATLHEKMAACLRTDRKLSDCRQEMMKSCKEQMGKDGCPMMGRDGMHHHGMGMGHDKMTPPPEAAKK
ncbi:hypothetical protein WDW37_04060 [Bdellovibrionota bacterium FG-1]